MIYHRILSKRFLNGQKIIECLRTLHFTQNNNLFFEPDRTRGGDYKIKDDTSYITHIKDGWKELKYEIKLWVQEMKDKFECDPIICYSPGVIDKHWVLSKEEDIKNWIVTSDSDHAEGYSSCELNINKYGHGSFSGVLDTRVPKDGRIKRAGYCSIKTKRTRKSFKRETYYDWSQYTHLVVKLRGDGRTYILNIGTSGYFDQLWNDVYHYMLFTRGGPYWQISKIPFSKFIFASKGRIQDLQTPIDLEKVTSFGISVADGINGEFSLEIDYIGLEFDPLHEEEFAYEMYRTPKYLAAT